MNLRASARPIGKDHRGGVGPHLCSGGLVSLFFFPGVGVGDDEGVEGEGACCFRGGDQAVDGLGLSGEGVGGGAAPCGGQGDVAVFVGVGAVEHGAPALGWCVVVADQVRVGV